MATNPKLQAPWGEFIPYVGDMTVEQFEMFPSAEGWTYELHEGRIIAMPGPGFEHMFLEGKLLAILSAFLQAHGLGTMFGTGCYNLPLPNNTEELLCPDLSYVHPFRQASMPIRGSYLVGIPDLAVEISSPNDFRPQVHSKVQVYLQANVPLVWVLWPKTQTIDVWRPSAPNKPIATLKSGDVLDGLDVIPGFTCPVADIFAQ